MVPTGGPGLGDLPSHQIGSRQERFGQTGLIQERFTNRRLNLLPQFSIILNNHSPKNQFHFKHAFKQDIGRQRIQRLIQVLGFDATQKGLYFGRSGRHFQKTEANLYPSRVFLPIVPRFMKTEVPVNTICLYSPMSIDKLMMLVGCLLFVC